MESPVGTILSNLFMEQFEGKACPCTVVSYLLTVNIPVSNRPVNWNTPYSTDIGHSGRRTVHSRLEM